MTRRRRPALVIAFASTAQAMKAEEIFTREGLPGRMIPIPSQVTAGCGLAWKAEPEQESLLLEALRAGGGESEKSAVIEMFG